MSNTHTERPGGAPRQKTRNPSPHTPQSLTPPLPPARVPWEIEFISLLAVALDSRDGRIRYYEAEDRRKAQEIDRLRTARVEQRRRAA